MNTELSVAIDDALMTDVAPSADFVRAVSDFLDTDPADLLAELRYYERSGGSERRAVTEPVAAASGDS